MANLFVPKSPRVRVRSTADQNRANGSFLTFAANGSQNNDSHVYNQFGMYDSTVSNEDIVLPQSGVYLFTISVAFGPAQGTGYRQLILFSSNITGTSSNIVEYVNATGNATVMNMSYMGIGGAGQTYQVRVNHTFGGSVLVLANRLFFGATFMRPSV